MAVQTSTLTQLITELRRIAGETVAAESSFSDAELTVLINRYVQSIPQKVGVVLGGQNARLDMYYTTGTLTTSSGSSTATLPSDVDHWDSFHDSTNSERLIDVIEGVHRFSQNIDRFRDRSGPPEAIELTGTSNSAGVITYSGRLYPDTESGVTPSIAIKYWRIPASMPGTTPGSEYPDIAAGFEDLIVSGVAVKLLSPGDATYKVYMQQEQEMIQALAVNASIA